MRDYLWVICLTLKMLRNSLPLDSREPVIFPGLRENRIPLPVGFLCCEVGLLTPSNAVSHLMCRSGMLHSNPGDYAWGQTGLDAIVTQVRSCLRRVFVSGSRATGSLLSCYFLKWESLCFP